MKDGESCASASETIKRLRDAGPPAFDRVIYAHVQILRGDYAGALKDLDAGIPNENESTSGVVHFLAFSGKLLALLLAGRLGELVQLLRAAFLAAALVRRIGCGKGGRQRRVPR